MILLSGGNLGLYDGGGDGGLCVEMCAGGMFASDAVVVVVGFFLFLFLFFVFVFDFVGVFMGGCIICIVMCELELLVLYGGEYQPCENVEFCMSPC